MNLEQIRVILASFIRERELAHFIKCRKVKHMTTFLIRDMFIAQVKQAVSSMTVSDLAEICASGKDFSAEEYHDCTIVTHGTNAWSAVFLSNSDSGLVMLQKIATATLLHYLILIINDGPPIPKGRTEKTQSWYPFELRPIEEIDACRKLDDAMTQKLGW